MSQDIDIGIGWTSVGMRWGYAPWLADAEFSTGIAGGVVKLQLLGFYIEIWWHEAPQDD